MLCFPDRSLSTGEGDDFLAGHQLLEMGNAVARRSQRLHYMAS